MDFPEFNESELKELSLKLPCRVELFHSNVCRGVEKSWPYRIFRRESFHDLLPHQKRILIRTMVRDAVKLYKKYVNEHELKARVRNQRNRTLATYFEERFLKHRYNRIRALGEISSDSECSMTTVINTKDFEKESISSPRAKVESERDLNIENSETECSERKTRKHSRVIVSQSKHTGLRKLRKDIKTSKYSDSIAMHTRSKASVQPSEQPATETQSKTLDAIPSNVQQNPSTETVDINEIRQSQFKNYNSIATRTRNKASVQTRDPLISGTSQNTEKEIMMNTTLIPTQIHDLREQLLFFERDNYTPNDGVIVETLQNNTNDFSISDDSLLSNDSSEVVLVIDERFNCLMTDSSGSPAPISESSNISEPASCSTPHINQAEFVQIDSVNVRELRTSLDLFLMPLNDMYTTM